MKKRSIFWIAFVFTILTFYKADISYGAVHRIGGDNRCETAERIAGEFQWSDNAVIVSGDSYADALAAGPYAANIGGTIFLVQDGYDISTVLNKYQVKNVVIVGGEKAVSSRIEDKLRESFQVYRLGGENRYETARLVNEQTENLPINVGVATGRNFPDALAAGAFLAGKGYGLQIVDGREGFRLPESFAGHYTFGAEAAVKFSMGERIAGADRYETAANIAKKMGDYQAVVVASGENFPDALAVTAFAKSVNAPVILTRRDSLPSVSKEAIQKARDIYIIGGEGAVSKRVENQILGKEEPTPKPNPQPEKPELVTKNGITTIDGILIVNKNYSLPSNYNPGLSQNVRDYFERMKRAAAGQGLSISIGSGFRSYSYQKKLYEGYVRQYGRQYADRISARPGHSEHQSGLAVDIKGSSYYLNQKFAGTKEGIWLAKNAHKYGFHLRYPKGKESITGYIFEPWHFRYVGENLATKLYQSGKTIEEYYGL